MIQYQYFVRYSTVQYSTTVRGESKRFSFSQLRYTTVRDPGQQLSADSLPSYHISDWLVNGKVNTSPMEGNERGLSLTETYFLHTLILYLHSTVLYYSTYTLCTV